ncbi:MAG: SDR family NAD(P)-dependent oxidoreductase, partial [Candidatus Tectomicrobia bacterium]
NIGLGFQTSLELSRRGAVVTIACRSIEKGELAIKRIRNEVPEARLNTMPLDLVNADSISSFSERFCAENERLDILVCNAGVVNLDSRRLTTEGREMHMATNHFGHFSLTGCLFPIIKSTEGARVVVLSSLAYQQGVIDFTDLDWNKRKYDRMKCYGDSKLANLLFMIELNRAFERCGASAIAVAAHPGLTATERQQSIGIGGVLARWLASPVEKGCLPQLLAATEPAVRAGEFYGPRYGLLGKPSKISLKPNAKDSEVSKKLWEFSETVTGVRYL